MDPGSHRDLALAAERAGVSINALVVACVEREVGGGREAGVGAASGALSL